MHKKNYYCLIAGLPEIMADDNKIPFSVKIFKNELKEYLTVKDMELADLFFLEEDNKVLLSLINKEEPQESSEGNFSVSLLESQLKEPDDLPTYMAEFIELVNSDKNEQGISHENELTRLFYNYLLQGKNKFAASWFEYDMNIRNLTTALNCRKYNIDIEKSIVGDNEFARALKSSNLKDFGLSTDYDFVEKVISLMEKDNTVEKERGLDLLRWNYLDEKTVFEYFSIEKVLSYLIKLKIIERWSKLNDESGRVVFEELVERLRASFEFSKEFKV